MKTEIQFLLELVLNHKLAPEAKKLCLERIGDVESKLGQMPAYMPQARSIAPQVVQQSPSTIAILEKHAAEAIENGVPAPVAVSIVPTNKRIIGGEVQTGNGTRGPRKF